MLLGGSGVGFPTIYLYWMTRLHLPDRHDTIISLNLRPTGQVFIQLGDSQLSVFGDDGQDFSSQFEDNGELRFSIETNSLTIAGPNSPTNTSQDDTERYNYFPSNSAEILALYNIYFGGPATLTLAGPLFLTIMSLLPPLPPRLPRRRSTF